MGLLQIMNRQTNNPLKTNKMQRRVDRIEQAIEAFFKVCLHCIFICLEPLCISDPFCWTPCQDLANRIEDIEGLDLTDKGDDIVGLGLCMLAGSDTNVIKSCSSSEEDSDFECNNDDDEEDDEEEEEEEEEDTNNKRMSSSSGEEESDEEDHLTKKQCV